MAVFAMIMASSLSVAAEESTPYKETILTKARSISDAFLSKYMDITEEKTDLVSPLGDTELVVF